MIGLTLPSHTPIEQVFESANEMVQHSNEIKIHFVCKQKGVNWNDTHVACVSSEKNRSYINDLSFQGYSDGPAPSREFCVSEGQNIHFFCSGNIQADFHRTTLKSLRNYPDCITCNLSVFYEYLQKDKQYYGGHLIFQSKTGQLLEKLPLYLKKEIRSQHYKYRSKYVMDTKVSALVKYIAWKLNENDESKDWDQFVNY